MRVWKSRKFRMLTPGILVWLVIGNGYALTLLRTEAVALSKQDYAAVESIACRASYQVAALEIKATLNLDNPKSKTAVVTCSANREFMGSTGNYIVYCGTAGGAWECQKGPLRVAVPIQGRQVKLYLMGVEPQEAFEGLSKVSHLRFQGVLVNTLIGEFCDISKNKFPDEMEFHCDNGKFVVSTYCVDKNCPRILSVN
jgi:hypothetical protein